MTTTADAILLGASVGPRIVRGQYEIDGELYTRATTFAGTIDDRWNLERWQQRMVAVGLTQRPDLYAQVAANHDDKKTIDRLCDEAREAAKGSAAANTGNALHSFTERVDRGEAVNIPAPWDADIDAYTATLAANGVRVDPVFMERVVLHRGLRVAGRFDRIVGVDGLPLPMVADLKTGATLDFSWCAIAQQLAIYANADQIIGADGRLLPMPQVDLRRALVIHLPAGQATCTLHLVDIEAGWAAVQLSAAVRDWRRRKDLTQPFESPWQQRAAHYAERVRSIKDNHPQALASLAEMWPDGVPTFRQGGPRNADDVDRLAVAVTTVEAQHRIAFPVDGDPAHQPADQATRDALERRLRGLPVDLLEQVRADAVDVPNVQTSRFTMRHAEILAPLIDTAEVAHREMRRVAQALLDDIGGDEAQTAAVVSACGTDGATWTRRQLDILGELADLAAAGALGWTVDDDGATRLVCVDAEKRLVDIYGAKREALAAVKQIADAFGLPKPRALSGCVDHPALVAMAGAANSERENQR